MKEAEIEVIGVDIKAKLWEDPIDVQAINALVDKKYDLKKEKTKYLIATCAALKGILTDSQKDKVKELYKSKAKVMGSEKHHGKMKK